ncbi:hypothetical protein [Streptomyces sp. NPDC001410]|uniref:hypothetical protein n=1 Tax=Streptomyces sp. NPDC001410 TaxID=3364574 RepID=UPI0036C6E3E6
MREDGKIRVFPLADHEVVRHVVPETLPVEADIEMIGEAGTTADAPARIPATRPDATVLGGPPAGLCQNDQELRFRRARRTLRMQGKSAEAIEGPVRFYRGFT